MLSLRGANRQQRQWRSLWYRFASTRRMLSAGWDDSLKIWDAGSGDCLLTLSGHSGSVRGCAWSPDGRRVLSSSEDDSLKIWDAGSGECLLTLSGNGIVYGCAWSPDGGRILASVVSTI